ncbi:poly-gamma-glutamate hydrolase family protein, partial [Staphylococcus warneri]|uniref:poly-gamma-glutamate hydrolase family protein n=1 Tax=Staphylococcus warneri TaxID=1292 RepID=UPI001643E942
QQTLSIHAFSQDHPILFLPRKHKKIPKSIPKSLPHKAFTLKQSPNHIHPKSSKNFLNHNQNHSPLQLQLTTKQTQHFFKNHNLTTKVPSNAHNYTKTFYKFANPLQHALKKPK